MTGGPDPQGMFRDELVAAGARHHARRRHRLTVLRRAGSAVAAILIVSVAAIAAVGSFASKPASASVIVTRDGNMFEVLVADDDATAAMVEAALADHGADAVVDAVPVGPSRVGQFVSGDGTVSPSGGQLSSATVRFPADQRRVHLLFGRPAEPGESYVAVSDAFAAGEPLECRDGIWRERAEVAVPAVRVRFDDVTVLGDDGQPVDDPSAGTVGDVVVIAPGRALVRIHAGEVPPGTVDGSAECPLR